MILLQKTDGKTMALLHAYQTKYKVLVENVIAPQVFALSTQGAVR